MNLICQECENYSNIDKYPLYKWSKKLSEEILYMYMIIGLALSVFSIGWANFSPYYPYIGWLTGIIGIYLILKGREKMGLKNK